MPIDPSILVSTVAGIGQGLQGFITGQQNKEQRGWNEKMYDIQRRDALADWSMQNEYNSPAAQMSRLKAAGLNPNLVYGQGAVANNATAPRSASVESYKPMPIQFDSSSIIGQAYDTKLRQAQTDNLEAQRKVIEQDAALRAAQIIAVTKGASKTDIDTEQSAFNLQMARGLQDTTIAAAEANLKKTLADVDYTISQNERADSANAATLAQAAEAILRSRSDRETSAVQRRQLEEQIKAIRNDNRLKELDIELRKMGIFPQDPMWSRILGRIVGDPEKAYDNIKKDWQDIKKAVRVPDQIPDSLLKKLYVPKR